MSSKMSSEISSKFGNKFTHVANELTGWDAAIRDTEAEILKVKQRLASLRSALRVFKERKESGEPFPSEKIEQKKDSEG